MVKISLVIIVENSYEYLPSLFESIGSELFSESIEVILIDNSEKTSHADILNSYPTLMIFSFSDAVHNKGILYNKGIELATNSYVVFAHSDIYFRPCFFMRLQQYIESGEQFDALYFRQYYADLNFYGYDELGMDSGKLVYRHIFMSPLSEPNLVIQGTESCFLINLDSLENIKFSEEFHQSFYEFDLFMALMKLGKTFKLVESCEYIHYFIELHEKKKFQYLDSAIFAYRNPEIYCMDAVRLLNAELEELKGILEHQQVAIGELNSKIALGLTESECKVRVVENALTIKTEQLIEAENELIEAENKLIKIEGSRGWKMLCYLYKIQDVLIPLSSRRRGIAKMIYKCIKTPR